MKELKKKNNALGGVHLQAIVDVGRHKWRSHHSNQLSERCLKTQRKRDFTQ